jgi:NitT/TauT family transport system permease protein
MAVTPTFPSRDSLRRLRFRPLDAVVGAGVFLLIYAAVRVGAIAHVPIRAGRVSTIDTSPSRLPYYAARSLLRMFVALFSPIRSAWVTPMWPRGTGAPGG